MDENINKNEFNQGNDIVLGTMSSNSHAESIEVTIANNNNPVNPHDVMINRRYSAIVSPSKSNAASQRRMTEPVKRSTSDEGGDSEQPEQGKGAKIIKRLSVSWGDAAAAATAAAAGVDAEDQPPASVSATQSHSKFMVRDLQYKSLKKKAPSLSPMYDIKGAVCFNTKQKVDCAVDVCKELWGSGKDEVRALCEHRVIGGRPLTLPPRAQTQPPRVKGD